MISETILFGMLILFSQPIYLDEAGQQEKMLHIVDKICDDTGECPEDKVGLATSNEMWITQGHFGTTYNAQLSQYIGCTTFLHERYHIIHGDWYHEIMPHGCEGVW